jgi:hypothetical protein
MNSRHRIHDCYLADVERRVETVERAAEGIHNVFEVHVGDRVGDTFSSDSAASR